MAFVCKYFGQCLDRQPTKHPTHPLMWNDKCSECANNPYGKQGHYFEPIKEEANR